jgi:hypothetical protein
LEASAAELTRFSHDALLTFFQLGFKVAAAPSVPFEEWRSTLFAKLVHIIDVSLHRNQRRLLLVRQNVR